MFMPLKISARYNLHGEQIRIKQQFNTRHSRPYVLLDRKIQGNVPLCVYA